MTYGYTRYDQKTVYYADNNNRLLEEQDSLQKRGGEMIESIVIKNDQ